MKVRSVDGAAWVLIRYRLGGAHGEGTGAVVFLQRGISGIRRRKRDRRATRAFVDRYEDALWSSVQQYTVLLLRLVQIPHRSRTGERIITVLPTVLALVENVA